MTSEMQNAMRLGTLLVELGIMSQPDLSEAAQLAVELGLPLGKVLVMSGFLTDQQLQAIVHAQSMLKDNLITRDVAQTAIGLVSEFGISWEEALKRSGWVQPEVLPSNKLGAVLISAGIISQIELEHALEQSRASGLPLGRILALTNKISNTLLYSCLNAQVLLRDGKISREQAITGLKAAQQRQQSIEQALIDQGMYKPPAKARIKLGEMLVLSGVLNEETIMQAIEIGLVNNEPIGQVLVKAGYISINLLDVALKLQEMVDNGTLSPISSSEVLREVVARNISIGEAVANLGLSRGAPTHVNLGDILKLSGVLTEDDIQEAFARAMQNSTLLSKILTITGFVDDDTMQAALRCLSLVKQGALQQDQAIIAMNYCRRMRRSLDEALQELGWVQQQRTEAPDRTTADQQRPNVGTAT